LALPLTAQEIHLKLPKRSHATPVQKLNQDGVKAIKKHDYDRAKQLFYRAYLLDPNDPFTLNNLGYIAELDGEIGRAQRFYELASEQPSQATIAFASSPDVEGKEAVDIAGNAVDTKMQINRDNIYAMSLLLKNHAPEADMTLKKALKLDPKNPFTLNNMGFAKEKEGELELALKYYSDAAMTGSNEPVIVTVNKNWRGKPIREIAAENARKVRKEIDRGETPEMQIARLNLRGVSAINRNDRRLARQYFQQAYKLDPDNSFTLNNMGYLAETDGDRETADFFYAKAREARRNDDRVVEATRRDMEGLRVGAVAASNDQSVLEAQQRSLEARRRKGGPVSLMLRNDTPVIEPATPVHPTHRDSAAPVVIPRERSLAQPSIEPVIPTGQPSKNVILPPTNGQPVGVPSPSPMYPSSSQPPSTQPNQPQGGVIEPLTDNQHPRNAGKSAPIQQPKTAPQSDRQPPP
jgi:Flp pilus assembly protein TadD